MYEYYWTIPWTACQHPWGRTLVRRQFFQQKTAGHFFGNSVPDWSGFQQKRVRKHANLSRKYREYIRVYMYDRVESKTLNRTYPITYKVRSFRPKLLFHPILGQKFAFCELSNRHKHPRPPHFTGRRPNRKIFFAPTKKISILVLNSLAYVSSRTKPQIPPQTAGLDTGRIRRQIGHQTFPPRSL